MLRGLLFLNDINTRLPKQERVSFPKGHEVDAALAIASLVASWHMSNEPDSQVTERAFDVAAYLQDGKVTQKPNGTEVRSTSPARYNKRTLVAVASAAAELIKTGGLVREPELKSTEPEAGGPEGSAVLIETIKKLVEAGAIQSGYGTGIAVVLGLADTDSLPDTAKPKLDALIIVTVDTLRKQIAFHKARRKPSPVIETVIGTGRDGIGAKGVGGYVEMLFAERASVAADAHENPAPPDRAEIYNEVLLRIARELEGLYQSQ